MWDVFLSHTFADKDFVRKLASDLDKKGFDVWLDEWELAVGDSLREKVEEGIKESASVAVVLSPNSVKSKWVSVEINAAFAHQLEQKSVFLLPVLYKPCEIPPFLKDKVYADFTQAYDNGLVALVKRLLASKIIQYGFPTVYTQIDDSTLRSLINSYAQIMHTTISILSTDGRRAVSEQMQWPMFCHSLRTSFEDAARSDKRALRQVKETRTSLMYECHTGLIDFAVPIMVEAEVVGAVFCGQRRLREPDRTIINKLNDLDHKSGKPKGTLLSQLREIEVVDMTTVEKEMKLLVNLADKIGSQCGELFTQRKLLSDGHRQTQQMRSTPKKTLRVSGRDRKIYRSQHKSRRGKRKPRKG